MNFDLSNLEGKVITLRTVYKEKTYSFQPVKQANGMNLPFVKPVRMGVDGMSEMVLSENERNNPESAYFIPEDMDIIVKEGTTFNMKDPLERNKFLAICNSSLIAPSRNAKDQNGNLIIDGTKERYGMAEIYIDVPGEESERSVNKKRQITRAWTFIENDSVDGLLTKCKLLGRNMRNAPISDVQDYLYQVAEKKPNIIIDLYTGSDTSLKLMLIDAKERNVIRKENGLYMYGDTPLGPTDDSVLAWFKTPSNKVMFEYIRDAVYPDLARKVRKEVSEVTVDDSAEDVLNGETEVVDEIPIPKKTTVKKK